MQIVQELAGYTMGQADNIRRAMSKKKQYVIDAERKNFVYGNEEEHIKGCVRNGISEAVANEIYDSMVDFAKYAFNKSHAACYAIIAFQTAWLKYYYPVEYMAALMTSVMTNTDKLTGYIQAGKEQGIELVAPNINESEEIFLAKDNKILFALCGIKGLSSDIAEAIKKEREQNGLYLEFEDAVKRCNQVGVSKKAIANLIYAGGFDEFNGTRKQYETVLDDIVNSISSEKKKNIIGQMSLFDTGELENELSLPDVGEYDQKEKLQFEKEVTGIYISGHPLGDYKELIEKYTNVNTSDFTRNEEDYTINVFNEQEISIGGIIKTIKVVFTKKDSKPMCFLTLEDLYGTVEVVVFPKQYSLYKDILKEDRKIFIKGTASVEEDKNGSIVSDEIKDLDTIPMKLWLKFSNMEEYKKNKDKIEEYKCCNGKDTLIIFISDTKEKKFIQNYITADIEVIKRMKQVFGEGNIAFTL